MGNGFDLSCGLKSSYNNFFNDRLNKLFNNENFDSIDDEFKSTIIAKTEDNYRVNGFYAVNRSISLNISYDLFTYNVKNHNDKSIWSKLNRWDIFFLLAKYYLDNSELEQWQDIENIIFNIITIVLNIERRKISSKDDPRLKLVNLTFKGKNNFNKFRNKAEFIYWVQMFSNNYLNDKEMIAQTLLEDLNEFEKDFGKYIWNQVEGSKKYLSNANRLFEKLIVRGSGKNTINVDVLSFNYSLGSENKSLSKAINCSTWNNVHGLAYNNSLESAPIFGIDNHDIAKEDSVDDLRVMFTKSYRIMDNENGTVVKRPDFSNIDEIIIYGHSLGRADYTYFISLFDECDLYDRNVKLTFYFWPGNESNSVSIQRQRRKYTQAVTNLLNSYGRTSDKAHGENMLTKLELEKRISVRQNPEL